jgi:hypothetical protein
MAFVLVGAGCSMGARQAQADRIMSSVGALRRTGQAQGHVAAHFTVVHLPEVLQLNAPRVNNATITLSGGFDLAHNRVRLGGGPDGDLVIFDDTTAYVRRLGREAAGTTSTRDWARLDYATLGKVSRPSAEASLGTAGPSTMGLLNPMFAVELTSGALTGSVKQRGTAVVRGVTTTRYDANFSFDKAYSKLHFDERAADARRRVRTLLAISGDIVPGHVWIDSAGRPVRTQFTFTQRATRRMELKTEITVDFDQFGAPAAVTLPGDKQTLQVETTSELLRGLAR